MNQKVLVLMLLLSAATVLFVSFSTTLKLQISNFSDRIDADIPRIEEKSAGSKFGDRETPQDAASPQTTRGRLRRDWTNNPPLSPYGRQILQHQSNCTLPVQTFHMDNAFGLGAHFTLWSQGICNAMEQHSRLRTYNPDWLWLDQTKCDSKTAEKSPLLCYLPESEYLCGNEEALLSPFANNVTDPRDRKQWCRLLYQPRPRGEIKYDPVLDEFRAATTEFLFRKVSRVVIEEAERQASLVFQDGIAPSDLISVHMRWGDKFWEMNLAHELEYIKAISDLLHKQKKDNRTASIYLATEDPRARDAFLNVTPPGWKVYLDRTIEELDEFRPKRGNRASHTARNTQGRAGLVALGSLLLSMEANYFVLTTRSNWSRLMNQLRTKIIDPRCGNCTRMVDLRPGIW